MARPKKKHPGGRPTKITPECIQKLEDAYLIGATNLEASIYAGISESLLYEFKKENPKFVERIKALRDDTTFCAKLNLRNSIKDGNLYDSKWHLERRDPEYKPKSSQDVNHGAQKSLIDAILEFEKRDK
jgi:hypothetical protein